MFEVRAKRLGGALITLCAAMTAGLAVAGLPDKPGAGVDASIRPGDDFYGYANGDWLKATRLPEGVASLDTSAMLRVENARRVHELIEHPTGPNARKIADYYASWLDRAGIEAKGFAPLSHDLAAIAAITGRHALATYLGRTVRLDDGTNTGTESLFGVWVHQGFHDPDHYAAHLVQGGLGLDKDDYLDPARRETYRAHVAKVLTLAGFDQPETRAARVLDLETAIARTHASRADTDDVYKTDNSWHRVDFAQKAPGLDWDTYFAASGLDRARSFVVWQPGAVIGSSKLAATQPLEAWRDYLAFHLIEHYAAVLPRAVSGDPAPPAIAATEAAFGDAVGHLYVQRYFPPRAKAATAQMVANLRAAFAQRLASSRWMAPETRAKALAKLAALRIGLGYPERWIDYAPLAVVRGDAFGNLRRAEAFAYARATARLSRPVDPDEWPAQLHPQTVGAILDISPNTMEFSAGLFQPPYFDPTGDAAANYGSAGAGIAHEISHSFDELGNQYDARGRLVRWWTTADLTRYRAASDPLASQLDSCAHGKQILGESAADLAGLAVAHDAYLRSLHDRADAVKNGMTGDQRFFIAFAQRWRRLQTEAALRRQIETDTHAPPQCRSDLVRNHDAWASAFGVRPGDKLYLKPVDRILVW